MSTTQNFVRILNYMVVLRIYPPDPKTIPRASGFMPTSSGVIDEEDLIRLRPFPLQNERSTLVGGVFLRTNPKIVTTFGYRHMYFSIYRIKIILSLRIIFTMLFYGGADRRLLPIRGIISVIRFSTLRYRTLCKYFFYFDGKIVIVLPVFVIRWSYLSSSLSWVYWILPSVWRLIRSVGLMNLGVPSWRRMILGLPVFDGCCFCL
jgi:hypothetical protein